MLKIEKTEKLISPRESRTDRSKDRASPKWEVAEISIQPLPLPQPLPQPKSRRQSPSQPAKDAPRDPKQAQVPAIKMKPQPQPVEQPKTAKQEQAEQFKKEKRQLKEEAERQKEREQEQQKKKKLQGELDREELRQAKMIKKIEAEMSKATDEMRRLLEMKRKAEENLLQISKYSPLTSLKTKKINPHKPRPEAPEPKTRESSPVDSRKEELSVTYSDFSTKRPASHPKKTHPAKPEASQNATPRVEVPRLKTSLKKSQGGLEGPETGRDTSRSLSSRRNLREEPMSQTLPLQEPLKSEQSKLSRSLRSSSSVKKVSFDIPSAPEQPQLSRGKSETGRSARADAQGPVVRSPEKPGSGLQAASRQASTKKLQPVRSSVDKRLVFELSVSKENRQRGSLEFYDPSMPNDPSFVKVHDNQFETLGGHQGPEAPPGLAEPAKHRPQKPRPKQPDRAPQPHKKTDLADSQALGPQKDAPQPRKKEPAAAVDLKPVRSDHSRKKVPATFSKPAPEEAAPKPGKSPRPEPAAREKASNPKWNGSAKVAGPQPARDAKPQPVIQELSRGDGKKEADPQDRSASRKSDRSLPSSGKPPRRHSLEEEWALKKPRRNPRNPPARPDPASLPPGTLRSPRKKNPARPAARAAQAAGQAAGGEACGPSSAVPPDPGPLAPGAPHPEAPADRRGGGGAGCAAGARGLWEEGSAFSGPRLGAAGRHDEHESLRRVGHQPDELQHAHLRRVRRAAAEHLRVPQDAQPRVVAVDAACRASRTRASGRRSRRSRLCSSRRRAAGGRPRGLRAWRSCSSPD